MKRFLIVDDDTSFCEALSDNFTKRSFEVQTATNFDDAILIASNFNPENILVDLKIKDSSGLELIPKLLNINPKFRIVVLTGYANINTAVEAIKLGALHYLSKPVSTDEIVAAFEKSQGDPQTPVEAPSLKLNIAEKEHILSAFERNGRNISATARELGMHRRTLQRKLNKLI